MLVDVLTGVLADTWSDVTIGIVPGIGVGVLSGVNATFLAVVVTVLEFALPEA